MWGRAKTNFYKAERGRKSISCCLVILLVSDAVSRPEMWAMAERSFLVFPRKSGSAINFPLLKCLFIERIFFHTGALFRKTSVPRRAFLIFQLLTPGET